jgi:hypothetical protein
MLVLQVTPRLSFPYFECAILLGGRLGEGLSNDVECYRSDNGEFTSLKPLPFKKRNEFAACAIGDEIFVSGGLRSGEFWKYDPTFESWLRGASMIQPRRRHAMAAVDDTIFVLGGFDEDQVLDSIEVWERKSNKVSTASVFFFFACILHVVWFCCCCFFCLLVFFLCLFFCFFVVFF